MTLGWIQSDDIERWWTYYGDIESAEQSSGIRLNQEDISHDLTTC